MSTLESFNRSNRILWQIGLLVLLMILVSACGLGGALSSPEDSPGDKAVSEERAHPGDDTLTHADLAESKVEVPAAEEAYPVEVEKEVESLAVASAATPAPLATAAVAEPEMAPNIIHVKVVT